MNENSMQSQSHIDSIVRQEEEALERRSSSERLADAVGVFAGSLFSVVLHLMLLVAWLLINSGKIPIARPFDPYPFSVLGVIVAVEAVILSSFILMRQNRMMRRGERRDHLTYRKIKLSCSKSHATRTGSADNGEIPTRIMGRFEKQ
jgi:uncharacterized membrane protein